MDARRPAGDDWAALDARYEGFDPETIDDVSAMVDAMAKDVRWPRTMQDDAEEAVEEMRTLIEEMDGVDINSAEAQDIADRADVDAFKRVGDFGDDSC